MTNQVIIKYATDPDDPKNSGLELSFVDHARTEVYSMSTFNDHITIELNLHIINWVRDGLLPLRSENPLLLKDSREVEIANEFATDGSTFALGQIVYHNHIQGTYRAIPGESK